MSIRLLNDIEDGTIPVSEMKRGQYGVIVGGLHDGHVVMPVFYNHGLYLCDLTENDLWGVELKDRFSLDDLRVRILPNNSKLIIEDNE